MVNKNSNQNSLSDIIIFVIEKEKPRTVKQLIHLIQEKHKIPEDKIIEQVINLQNQGKLTFGESSKQSSPTSMAYFLSHNAYWYWAIAALSIITSVLVFTVPENYVPIVYARYILGAIFVLFLPGFSFIKALFPERELDNIERVALSIGMSLALASITGLLLNYTPWGIRQNPVTLSLLALTTSFATIAIMREYQTRKKATD